MGVNLEAAKAELEKANKEEKDRKSRKVKTLKFEVGETPSRLLPPVDDYPLAWVTVKQHFSFLKNKKLPITCPKSFDEKSVCPLCDWSDELRKRGKENNCKEDSQEGWDKRQQASHIAQMLKLDMQGNHDGNVYKIYLKETLRKKFLGWFGNPWYLDFTDYVTGRNLLIKRVGTDKTDTKYDAEISPEKTPITNWETIKAKMLSLRDMLEEYKKQMYTTEQLKGILDGTFVPDINEKDEENDEVKPNAPSSNKKAELEAELEMLAAKNRQN